MAENSAKNRKCPKKWTSRIPHNKIAYVVNCSPNTVKSIRIGQRSNETDLGQRIELAEILLEEGENKLLEKVKELVQFK